MSASASNQFVMIGLPASGKTTFLAALWYLVLHEEVKHRLRLERLEGDNSYLNKMSNLWASFQEVPRTPTGTERTVSMFLNDIVDKKTMTLIFPDLSGESFMSQWVDRHFTKSYDEFLKQLYPGVLCQFVVSPLT